MAGVDGRSTEPEASPRSGARAQYAALAGLRDQVPLRGCE